MTAEEVQWYRERQIAAKEVELRKLGKRLRRTKRLLRDARVGMDRTDAVEDWKDKTCREQL